MKFIRKLPSDEICIEMIKSGMTVPEILKKCGVKGTSNNTLNNLADRHHLKINKKKRSENKVYKYKQIDKARSEYEDIAEDNQYHLWDIYTKGQTIQLQGHKWTIQSINNGRRKLYHTVNEIGLKETFDCLQLRQGNLL